MTTLHISHARTVLDRLFAASARQEASPATIPAGFSWKEGSAQSRADAMQSVYMPISERGGELLYSLVRSGRPDTVVEFGTSFGISTIYLAAALADNAKGHVFTTELSASKADAARRNLAEAGVADRVTILVGDALQTLRDVSGPVGIALLDGWKEMCLPVLKLLEPHLAPGALVVGDDISFESMSDYLRYVRDPGNGYISVEFPVEDGMEISCRTALS